MRMFLTWLLALGLVVTPALAGTDGAGDEKNTTASNTINPTAAADKDKLGGATASASTVVSATPTPSSLEGEFQQLRDLLTAQSKMLQAQSEQLQAQSEQLKEQQQRMEVLESEVNSGGSRDSFSVAESGYAPDSHTAGVASVPVSSVPAGIASQSPQLGNESPRAIQFKGITITPGGFVAAQTVFRNKAIGADAVTPFNSIPFPGNSGSQTTEFNGSARLSRLSLLTEAKLATVKLTGYFETDFNGAGITSSNNQSNNYVLRLRQAWAQAKFDNGWTLTGGQMWSLVTETKKGVENRTEAYPMTIDTEFNAGFSWLWQWGVRAAKSLDDGKFTLAASVEESATTATVHGNPTVTVLSTTTGNQSGVSTAILTSTTSNNFLIGAPGVSAGTYNPTGSYAYNKTPDFIFKAAADPGWGHFEVFGLISTFRDRIFPCYYANPGFNFPTLPGEDPANLPTNIPPTICASTGSTSPSSGAFNSSSIGGGIGANGRVSLLSKKVDLGLHFLGGDGIGRYGTAQLPDTTVRPDGTLALLKSYQTIGTLELHPTPKLDVYFYVGGQYSNRASYAYTNLVTGKAGTAGYGSPAFRNDGCFVEPLPVVAPGNPPNTTSVLGSTGFIPGSLANCAGDTRNIIEGTVGFWYRFYNGEKGRIQWGPQYSYVVRNTWAGATSTTVSGVSVPILSQPHGIDNMIFTSFRYYLP